LGNPEISNAKIVLKNTRIGRKNPKKQGEMCEFPGFSPEQRKKVKKLEKIFCTPVQGAGKWAENILSFGEKRG
jgi:hypothetical protein